MQKALPAAKETKLLGYTDDTTKALTHVDDEIKALSAPAMTRADAKNLQDIAARDAKRLAGTATKHEKEMAKADHQLRNEIYKRYRGLYGDNERIEMAGNFSEPE